MLCAKAAPVLPLVPRIKLIKIVTDAAMVDARHAEWLLERCHPSEFGHSTQVTGKNGAPLGGPEL